MTSIAIRGLLAATLVASLAATSYAQEARVKLMSSTRPGADAQFASARTAPKSTAALRRTIAVDLSRASLEAALVEITRTAGIELTYSKELLPGDDAEDRVTLQATSIGVGDALEQVLRGTGLDVLVSEEGMAVLVRRPEPPAEPTPAEPQTGTIGGRVTDARSGTGVSGANVLVEGTGFGTVTGNTGRYRIADVPAGTYSVLAEQVGYAEAGQSVTVSDGGEATVDFTLEVSALPLDEIVATGTAFETRVRTVPNPISVITAREIEQKQASTITDLLRGAIPGVMALSSGQDDYFSSIYVRGNASWGSGSGGDYIKIYIDGVEVAAPTFLSTIDPKSVERIEVVRGPQASAIYGSEASSGILQIFTKKGQPGLILPQFDLQSSAGMIESEYRPSHGSQPLTQDHSLAVSGGGESFSYRAAGSYATVGEWLTGYGSNTLSFSAGLQVAQGPLTAELTALWSDRDLDKGTSPIYRQWSSSPSCSWCGQPDLVYENWDFALSQNTMGLTLGYRATARWKHTLTLGDDQSRYAYHQPEPHLLTPADTFVGLFTRETRRRSIRYHTAYDAGLGQSLTGRFTLGVDYSSYDVQGSRGTNLLNAFGTVQTSSSTAASFQNDGWWNAGYFGMSELGLGDQFFVTLAARVEDNPNLGEEYGRAISPRIGASYVQALGPAEIKLRAQWGKGVRPPPDRARTGSAYSDVIYMPNPEIGPEEKVGWDAGIDVYWETRGSLSVTRYSEQGRNLIQPVNVDLTVVPQIYQYRNIGRVGSQGWEVEGAMNVGPVTLQANYAYSANRIRELSNQYVPGPNQVYQVGDRMLYTPTHSGGGTLTGRVGRTSASINASMMNTWRSFDYIAYYGYLYGEDAYRGSLRDYYVSYSDALWKWNLRAEQSLGERWTLFMRVENLTNNQGADYSNFNVNPGRATTAGFRLTF